MFPPVEEWGVDPLFLSCRKVFCGLLQNCLYYVERAKLIEMYYFGRPMSKAELVGIVVDIIRTAKRATVYIDDGTGVMPCIKFLNIHDPDAGPFAPDLSIGDLVTVRGKLIYLETNKELDIALHLQVDSLDVLDDPNLEALHWASSLHLHQTSYCKPYIKAPELAAAIKSVSGMGGSGLAPPCACIKASLLVRSQQSLIAPPSSSAESQRVAHNLANLERAMRIDSIHPCRMKLLYCPCVASRLEGAVAADSNFTFRFQFLQHLLSLMPKPESLERVTGLKVAFSELHAQSRLLTLARDCLAAEGRKGLEQVRGPLPAPPPLAPAQSDGRELNPKKSRGPVDSAACWDGFEEAEMLFMETCKALVRDGVLLERQVENKPDAPGSLHGKEFLLMTLKEELLPTLKCYEDAIRGSAAAAGAGVGVGGSDGEPEPNTVAAAVATATEGRRVLSQEALQFLQKVLPFVPSWRWEAAASTR